MRGTRRGNDKERAQVAKLPPGLDELWGGEELARELGREEVT